MISFWFFDSVEVCDVYMYRIQDFFFLLLLLLFSLLLVLFVLVKPHLLSCRDPKTCFLFSIKSE